MKIKLNTAYHADGTIRQQALIKHMEKKIRKYEDMAKDKKTTPNAAERMIFDQKADALFNLMRDITDYRIKGE